MLASVRVRYRPLIYGMENFLILWLKMIFQSRKENIIYLSDYNKMFWFLVIVSVNGLCSILINIKSDNLFKIITYVFTGIIFIISICLYFFDFWK